MTDFRLEMDSERIRVAAIGPKAFALCKRIGYSPDGEWIGNRECIALLKILSDEGMTWESK
jgi:hypothetical protein